MARALVIGASGFIGRRLVASLRLRGDVVFTAGRGGALQGGSVGTHWSMGAAPWPVPAWRDLLAAARPDVVFHLPGAVQGAEDDVASVNVGLAQGLLASLRAKKRQPVLVFAGSAAEVGGAIVDGQPIDEQTACAPLAPYGRTKLQQTLLALDHAAETAARVVVARIFNPVGLGMPEHLALPSLARRVAALGPVGGVLETGNLDVCRDFIAVEDAVAALIVLGNTDAASGIVNVCSGTTDSLRSIVDRLAKVAPWPVSPAVNPAFVRAAEPRVIVGSRDKLASLGFVPAAPDLDQIVPAVLAAVMAEAGPISNPSSAAPIASAQPARAAAGH